MLIYLLRHGETVYNAEKRYQGARDIPLSAAGRRALRRAEFNPERVYVSPLSRAVETAEVLFPEAALVPVDGLREMDFGDFEGRNYIEMADDPAYRAWVDGGCLERCPNGSEDRASFIDRTCAAFVELMDAETVEKAAQLVILAHGGTQMAVLSRYARPKRDFYGWQTGNASGFVLDGAAWRTERRLDLVGEVSYAASEGETE